MTLKYDKLLKHIREQDGEIRSFLDEAELQTAVGNYVGELVFVEPDKIFVRDGNDWVQTGGTTPDLSIYIKKEQNVLTKDPTGFDNPDGVIVTYDPTTRKVTLTGTFEAYYQGTKVDALVSGWVSDAHTATNGVWFLSYNGTAFVRGQTPWTFDQIQIAFVNYGVTDKFAIRETHGLMPFSVHQELHETIGTYLKSGGDLSGYTIGSTTAINRRPDVSTTAIKDEDITTTNPVLTSKLYTKHFLTSTGVTNFTVETAEIVPLLGNNPYYNAWDGANWIQTLMSNNSYMAVWLVAIPACNGANCQKYRYLWVQGQKNGALATIQAETTAGVNLGQLTSISPEFVFVSKIILRYTGGNWNITSVEKILGNKVSQVVTQGTGLSVVNHDNTLVGSGTPTDPLSVVKTWINLTSQRTLEPVSYNIQPTYEVLEYTYGTTKYYRRVYNTYDPTTDIFYAEPGLTTVVASRALSI